ncbi:hypothetical protein ACF1BR_08430 [Streptomyces rubiginosohelvolus]|uniref:hypothetical protein n=1 Tax=Streptomyces rubiginosohelvolus TaxID=67362 RepID=UPI0036FCC1B3
MAGASPVICRSGMAGRRATVSGGAMRCGRTAAGRDGGRTGAAALFPGPSVGRAGAGWAPVRSTESVEAEGPDVRAEFGELAELPELDVRAEPAELPELPEPEPAVADEPDELAEPTEPDGPDEPDRSEELPEADEPDEPDGAEEPGESADPAADRAASAGPDEPAVPDAAARPGEAAERDT